MADSNGSLYDWASFFASLYESNKKGRFQQVPQTPQQTDLYNFASSRVKALPDVNNAIFPTALTNATSSPLLDMDKLRRGEAGAYTAPARLNPAQLADILKGVNLGGSTSTTIPNTSQLNADGTPNLSGTGAGYSPGYTGSAPTASASPSAPDKQTAPSGPSDEPRGGETIYDYLTRNPGGSPSNYLPGGSTVGAGPGGDVPEWVGQYGNDPTFWDRVKEFAHSGNISDDMKAALTGWLSGGPFGAAAAEALNLGRNYFTTGKLNP